MYADDLSPGYAPGSYYTHDTPIIARRALRRNASWIDSKEMAGSQVRRRRFEFCRCHRMGPNPFLECPTCIGHPPTRNPFLLPSCFFFARETRIFLSFFHVVSSQIYGRVSALDSLYKFISFIVFLDSFLTLLLNDKKIESLIEQ